LRPPPDQPTGRQGLFSVKEPLRRADDQVALILRALPSIDTALRRGAIVVLERHRLRLRDLPITRRREEDI
jgi:hypothetical protein